MKNYMDIINAETELLKKKRKLELDYENEMKAIEKRLAEYEEYKNDFKNGNGDWALAKEYVTLYKPIDFDWYLSPEEITNKNIMEPKYGGHWIDNKFIENKEYKYFITELAAIVDSI